MNADAIEWAVSVLPSVQSWRPVWEQDRRRVFHLQTRYGDYYLRIAPRLAAERKRLDWFAGRLPVPEIVGFETRIDTDWLLTVGLDGCDLTHDEHEPAESIVELLSTALGAVHALPVADCPFGTPAADAVVTHGDACLPNFLAKNGTITGYLDLGAAGLAAPAVDLAAAVWSLQYNLGPGWGGPLLAAYGWPDTRRRDG